MKIRNFLGIVAVALIGVALGAQPVMAGPEGTAQFSENNPDEVKGHVAIVKAQVDKSLLAERDVWFAVQPVQAANQLWMQGSKVTNTKPIQVVYLGLKGVKTNELFQVHLVSCPQGSIAKDGPIPVAAIEQFDIEILDTFIIHRTE